MLLTSILPDRWQYIPERLGPWLKAVYDGALKLIKHISCQYRYRVTNYDYYVILKIEKVFSG